MSFEPMAPARLRLIQHLEEALRSQSDLGFAESDIDDVRRLISDTNVYLLAVTMVASVLHLLFEFLAFKSGQWPVVRESQLGKGLDCQI